MPETEGDFALSLEYFSLKTTFCKWQFFTQHISWSSGLSMVFPEYLPPKHIYCQNKQPGRSACAIKMLAAAHLRKPNGEHLWRERALFLANWWAHKAFMAAHPQLEVWSWRTTPRKIKLVDQPDWEWIRSLVPRGSSVGSCYMSSLAVDQCQWIQKPLVTKTGKESSGVVNAGTNTWCQHKFKRDLA